MSAPFLPRFSAAILFSLALHGALLTLPFIGSTSLFPVTTQKEIEFYTVTLEAHADDPAAGAPDGASDPSLPVAAPTIPPHAAKSEAEPKKIAQPKPVAPKPITPAAVPSLQPPAEPPQPAQSEGDAEAEGGAAQNQTPNSNEAVGDTASRARLGIPGGKGSELGVPYEQVVVRALARQKRYPDRARRKGITGEGTLRLVLGPSGLVETASVVRSTGSDLLDEEMNEMVERAAPFPASPPDYPIDRLEFLVPIKFALQ